MPGRDTHTAVVDGCKILTLRLGGLPNHAASSASDPMVVPTMPVERDFNIKGNLFPRASVTSDTSMKVSLITMLKLQALLQLSLSKPFLRKNVFFKF